VTPSERERVSIGFEGGQVLTARLSAEQLRQLRQALEARGWHELEHDEGTVALNCAQIVYVNVESSDHRVGFGT